MGSRGNLISRRKFMAGGSIATAAVLFQSKTVHAAPSEAGIGVQLYSVRQMLAQDFPGTLAKVADAGYRNVEAAGFYNHGATDVKQMMATAGLKCVSAHYSLADLLKAADATMEYANTLGLEYVICSSPSVADPAKFAHAPGGAWQAMQHGLTADDWKWNAGQFNEMGRKMKAQGLKFGYHNHTMEFHDLGAHERIPDTAQRYRSVPGDDGNGLRLGRGRRRQSGRVAHEVSDTIFDAACKGPEGRGTR